MFFKEDFIRLSGFVAEMMYRRRSNYKSSKSDFRQWVGTSLVGLPERLSSKYQSFILEYIFHVLVTEITWSNINAVALTLLDEETLSYDHVCKVMEQNNNPELINR